MEGGLGLLGVEAQYNALSSSLLIWILAAGDHPLKLILCSHIYMASARRWGAEDLTWIVTSCGTMKMGGSAPWRNLCSSWATLKKRLAPKRPVSVEEWGDLPLWRPHLNHVDGKLVRCTTIAQQSLRRAGLHFMADILTPGNVPIQWEGARRRGAPMNCERAFNALIQNLKVIPPPVIPEVGPLEDDQDMFLEDSCSGHMSGNMGLERGELLDSPIEIATSSWPSNSTHRCVTLKKVLSLDIPFLMESSALKSPNHNKSMHEPVTSI